jgi:glycosyltransferase involved in cell wall biosynthesis
MKIAYITAGAAGMFCGSCIHDNTLVTALRALGHDALLIPTYTPIRTDEADVSQQRVFFGGINVYLQQKLSLFRHTPWFFDRLWDAPPLLRWVSRFAVRTQADQLGDLTVSMLKGELGHQQKEIHKLVDWLADDHRPEVLTLTNALLSGIVPALKARIKAPILCALQGDDIFLEALPEAFKRQCLELIRKNCEQVDGFIATCRYYADFMAKYLGIPRARIDVIYPGLNLVGHGGETPRPKDRPPTIGYFARICPEKGLHNLVEAFLILRQTPNAPRYRLLISGWLGENNRAYCERLREKLRDAQLLDDMEHVECPDHESKVQFLQSLDVFSVPTTYHEPKGLYILEALANGVPVVQPRHGSFPELIEATGGGILVEPDNPEALAAALGSLLEDHPRRLELGRQGKNKVHEHFHAERMARETADLYRKYL